MSLHMPSEEFRRHGHAMIDWIADYLDGIEQYPVLAQVQPGEVRAQLPAHPPHTGEPFEAMMADVERIILPGITHWQSPSFFAFFPANTSGPAILGELLSAGLGVQGMIWATSPACTEVETHVLDWVVEMLGLPDRFRSTGLGGGVIQDSASSAALCALLAGRERASAFASNRAGCDGRLIAYTSNQAHSSIEKAAKIAGIGSEQLRLIGVDAAFGMNPAELEQRILADKAAGLIPCFVSATIGTTSSGAVDPLPEIGRICQEHGIWLHVDAAWAGTAALCPEFRGMQIGLELADSYCFNPHKWMFTNFDCTCFYVADRKALIDTLSILPEYLKNAATASGAVIDYRDWQVSLGRRFRALKLWFVIRHYGVEGLQSLIRQHVALAEQFVAWVRADARFELAAPPRLSLICLRLKNDDAGTQQLLERLNAAGEVYLTGTKLAGQYAIRVNIGQTHTELRHVQGLWEALKH
jgi:aromatic-L-amino-acid/L-tryptophan decarboxylase